MASQLKFMGVVVLQVAQFRGLGGLFHTPNHPVPPTERPNAKRKSKTKAFFDLFELISPPPSTCPITALVDPTRPSSHTLHPPIASKCVRGLHTPDIRLEPHIPPPYPATFTLVFEPLPSAVLHHRATRDPGVITQRIRMHIGTRISHVPLTNTEQLLGGGDPDFPILA
jgi:hypothetical protein